MDASLSLAFSVHYICITLHRLGLRIPLVPVGPEDGCMHVVPASHDELFASEDARHLRPSPSHGTALSCQAGEVQQDQRWIHLDGMTTL